MLPHQWFIELDMFFRQEIMRVANGHFPYMEDFIIVFRSRLGDAGQVVALVVVDVSVVSQFCLMKCTFVDETVLFQYFLRTFIVRITGIKRLPKRTQEELTVLLDLVRKSIENCQMVILFGSYARGNYVLWDSNIEFGVHTSYQSDYDILVVVTGQIKYVERKLHRITNQYHDLFAGRRHAFPQFVVEHINTVNRNLEVSQYFFTDIVKEGVMLYNSGKHELAKPRKLSFKEIRDIAQKEFDELYPYACGLLEGVNKFYLPEKQNKISAFLLHQTCEKLYNCILMVFTNYRPKSHKIKEFGGMVKRFSMELTTVFPQNTDTEKECFDLLCRSYIEARYNKDFSISQEQLEYLISRVDILRDVTERLCKEKIAEYDMMMQ